MKTDLLFFIFNTKSQFPRKKLTFAHEGSLLALNGIHGIPEVWDVNARREFPTLTEERARYGTYRNVGIFTRWENACQWQCGWHSPPMGLGENYRQKEAG